MNKLLIFLLLLSATAEAQLPRAYRKWKLGGVASTPPSSTVTAPPSTTTAPPSVTYNTANMTYGRIPVQGDWISSQDVSTGGTDKFVNGVLNEEFVIGFTAEGRIPRSPIVVSFPKSYSAILDSVYYGDGTNSAPAGAPMLAWTRNVADPTVKESAFPFYGQDRYVYQKHKFTTPRRTDYYEFERMYPNPTELVFVGWYYPQNFPAYSANTGVPLQNQLGFVTYQWNYQKPQAGGLDSAKLDIMRTGHIYRTYVDLELITQVKVGNGPDAGQLTGFLAFQPSAAGFWQIDDANKWAKDNGKLNIFCLKNGEPLPRYASTYAQVALRYGPNNTLSPNLSRVFTGPGDPVLGYQINTKKVGLNTVHYYQLGNEPNRWWACTQGANATCRVGLGNTYLASGVTARYDSVARGLLPESVITNPGGMMTPWEIAFTAKITADSIRKYDPTAHIILAGLASSNAQYLMGILQWCDIYNNGVFPWDGIAYHDYNNTNGGQQSGGNPAGVAPENAPYGAHMASIKQALKTFIPNKEVTLWQTETGYSIQNITPPATGNRENVAKTIYASDGVTVLRDRFQTQGDWLIRSSLMAMRKGLNGVMYYQLYDNNEYKYNPDGYSPWDASNGVAYEPTPQQESAGTHVRALRPATAFAAQILSFGRDYTFTSTVTDPTTGVIIDRFDKAGAGALYAVTKPTEDASTASITLSLPGVTSVTRYTLNDTGYTPTLTTLSVSGGNLTTTARETTHFIQVNN